MSSKIDGVPRDFLDKAVKLCHLLGTPPDSPRAKELRALLAELQATIARLTAENERLKGGQGEPVAYGMASQIERIRKRPEQGHMVYGSENGAYDFALYASQPAPGSVVMPERLDLPHRDEFESADQYAAAVGESKKWNECLDKVKELNK